MLTTETIYVQNIDCTKCMSKIVNALIKIEGVHDVTVAKEEGKVSIIGNGIPTEYIVQLLSEMGYPPTNNETILTKAKSFISYAIGKKVHA
jgi:copper chaperone CopZ